MVGRIFLGASLLVMSCARVPPYERGALAHPTMVPGDLAQPAAQHVRAVQEGAIGGGAAAGGGCGCN